MEEQIQFLQDYYRQSVEFFENDTTRCVIVSYGTILNYEPVRENTIEMFWVNTMANHYEMVEKSKLKELRKEEETQRQGRWNAAMSNGV
jgi:hypothetical protein